MKIAVTERAIFKKCRKRWEYQFVRNLAPIQEEFPALWIGIGVHDALENFYKGNDAMVALTSWWKANIETAPQNVIYNPEETWELMVSMVGGYTKFAETADQGMEVLATEHKLKVPIPGTDGVLSGRMDLLIRWHDKIWVVDHKTAASFVDEATLEFDDQMTAYIWMVQQATGENVSGAVYNQLKKKIPEKPIVLANGKALSQNKNISCTPDLYMEAISEHDFDPAEYREMIAFLDKNNAFFRREYITRTSKDVETFVKELAVEYSIMVQARALPAVFCHRNLTRDCGWCSFKLLCKSESSEDAFQARQLQEALFYVREVTPDDADSEHDDLRSPGTRENVPAGNGSGR